MALVTADHFGGNFVITNDTLLDNSPFLNMVKQVGFDHLRFPGGGITEDQTWENGGLDRLFGPPMDPQDENYVTTFAEMLEFSAENAIDIVIVIPTFQFFDKETGSFDQEGFDRYMVKLSDTLHDHPDARVSELEIGNEYWASLEPGEYGAIANAQLPQINSLADDLHDNLGWAKPGIGIQAGSAWQGYRDDQGRYHFTGPESSGKIAAEIEMDNRGFVTTIVQHTYPDLSNNPVMSTLIGRAVKPMNVFKDLEGFRDDLKFDISEFNIAVNTEVGVDQGAAWIDAFHEQLEQGVDSIEHWGLSYKWLTTKFYDAAMPASESDGGRIASKATPMGQTYDLAHANLVGKQTISDEEAIEGLRVSGELKITGFSSSDQRVVFLHNGGSGTQTIDFSDLPPGSHISVNHLVDADSPYTSWYDEKNHTPNGPEGIVDARGDMNVQSGSAAPGSITLGEGEMAVIVISEPGRDLVIEGAHEATDISNGMVHDVIFGGGGNDILRGHVGNDLLDGGEGNDVLLGGSGDDTLIGGSGNDAIFTGQGEDVVDGGEGDDLIIVNGGRGTGTPEGETDHTTITTGEGHDLILAGAGQKVTVTDFSDDDLIGFDGAFSDVAALAEASRIDGDDLIVSLSDGGFVRLMGQAWRLDSLENNVFDFGPAHDDVEEDALQWHALGDAEIDASIADDFFEGLNYQQVMEIYGVSGDVDGIGADGQGVSYWGDRDERIGRLELDNNQGPGAGGGDGGAPGDPDLPMRPVDPEEDVEEPQDEETAAGGACFVATAAYGDRLHDEVVALRHFRDEHLVRHRAGRAFVRLYWWVGPRLAQHVHPKQKRAAVARKILSKCVSRLRGMGLTGGA